MTKTLILTALLVLITGCSNSNRRDDFGDVFSNPGVLKCVANPGACQK